MDTLLWTLILALVTVLSIWTIGRGRRVTESPYNLISNQVHLEHSSRSVPLSSGQPNSQLQTDLAILQNRLRESLSYLEQNTHYYAEWSWDAKSYSEGFLTITHPYEWRVAEVLTWYCIPWINIYSGLGALGGSLSWVNTPYSVSSVLNDPASYKGMVEALPAIMSDYFRIDDDLDVALIDRFTGVRPFDQDPVTQSISKNISHLVDDNDRDKFQQVHYRHDRGIKVKILGQIPFNGTVIGDIIVNFSISSVICIEVTNRGLHYIIFYFDKSPSYVCEFHLVRLENSNFDEFDYCMAAYFIQNLRINSESLQFGQVNESQSAPTLAADWHNMFGDGFVPSVSLSSVDAMSGLEFEHFVGDLLKRRGFQVEVTKGSGDYGIDVVAKKQGIKYGVQVKRQVDKVSRNAVSDAVAGKMYYDCDCAMVVTNSYFHHSAIVLARATKCELIDRDVLEDWITETNT